MNTPLARYMQETQTDDAAFATLIGKHRSIVNRIRRGLLRPTLDVAADIEAKTNGAVPMQAWTLLSAPKPTPKPRRQQVVAS